MLAVRLLATYPAALAAMVLIGGGAAAALDSEEITDDFAMLQLSHNIAEASIDDDDADVYSAMQTEVGLLHGSRYVGTGQRYVDLEEDPFDGASLFQSESSLISKDAGKNCASGKADDDEGDAVSLIQTDAALTPPRRRRLEEEGRSGEPQDDETALFQTTITLGKGARRVGRTDLADDDDEEDFEDGTAFLQANVGLEQGGHGTTEGLNLNGVKICRRAKVDDDDEDENDEMSL